MCIIDEIIKMDEELKRENLSSDKDDKNTTVLHKKAEEIAKGHNTTVGEILRIYSIWKSKEFKDIV